MSVNASTTSVFLHNITMNSALVVGVRVVAYTRVGPGPYTPIATFTQEVNGPAARPTGQGPPHTWFVLLFAASVILFIVAFAVTLYLKKRQTLAKEIGHLNVPVANMNDLSHLSLMGGGGKDTLWIEGNWGTSKQLQLNDSNYSQVDSRSLSTFYSARKEVPTNPTPYATTTLINNLIPNNRIDSSETGPLIVPMTIRSCSDTKPLCISDAWSKTESDMKNMTNGNLMSSADGIQCKPRLFLPPPPQHPPPLPHSTDFAGTTRSYSQSGRSHGSPQMSRRFGSNMNNAVGPPMPPVRAGSGCNSYTSSWLSNQNVADQCHNQSLHRHPPPPLHPPPVPPMHGEHHMHGSVKDHHICNMYCNCSLLYVQPENTLEQPKNGSDRNSGSISGQSSSMREYERNSDTHGLASITQPDTMYSQIHLEQCRCEAGSWEGSCSCSESSCSYAQVNCPTSSLKRLS